MRVWIGPEPLAFAIARKSCLALAALLAATLTLHTWGSTCLFLLGTSCITLGMITAFNFGGAADFVRLKRDRMWWELAFYGGRVSGSSMSERFMRPSTGVCFGALGLVLIYFASGGT